MDKMTCRAEMVTAKFLFPAVCPVVAETVLLTTYSCIGQIYVFGKVRVQADDAANGAGGGGDSSSRFVSCCLVVQNNMRSMFVLPRLTGEVDDEGNSTRFNCQEVGRFCLPCSRPVRRTSCCARLAGVS